jgi:hypothetical protein
VITEGNIQRWRMAVKGAIITADPSMGILKDLFC